MWGNSASDWKTKAAPRLWTGLSVAWSNQTSSPSAMRPDCGRTRPAMAASVVDLPAPEGPNSTVMPGGARNATSRLKASAERESSTLSSLMGRPHQPVHRVEREDADRGQDEDHGH